jgi:hypothetical protein
MVAAMAAVVDEAMAIIMVAVKSTGTNALIISAVFGTEHTWQRERKRKHGHRRSNGIYFDGGHLEHRSVAGSDRAESETGSERAERADG